MSESPPTDAVAGKTPVDVGVDTSQEVHEFGSLVKAVRALSGEVELEKLLEALMHLMLDLVGAQRGSVVLSLAGESDIEVQAPGHRLPLRILRGPEIKLDRVPAKLTEWVQRTGDEIVLDEIAEDERFADDVYFARSRACSVLCQPIARKSGRAGWLYLESAKRAAFTPRKIDILHLLLAQATVSIENAVLYSDLHREIARREKAQIQLRRYAEDLEHKTNELGRKNAELESFTYTVSHDLKGPILTIRGFLGMLEKDAEAGRVERVQQDIERIRRATGSMHELLEGLLELSRVGRLVKLNEEVSLDEVVEEVKELLHGRLEECGGEVVTVDPLPTVLGDRIRLREVFQNLIENAFKFMGDQESPCVEIGIDPQEEVPTCFVKDNGIGIDPAYHDKVFQLFQRLNPEHEGSGIGLALVSRIVGVHGGRLWLESEGLGHGTTFWMTFPQDVERPPSFDSARRKK